MDAKVIWKEGLSFTATSDSGFHLNLGADESVGGANDGFRPLELMLISLIGCTAMDVISILQKKRQDVTGFEVAGHAERASEHPRVMTRAVVEYSIKGHGMAESAVRRALELSAVRYCSAQGMLSKVMPIELNYFIYEDEGDGKQSLASKGVYEKTL
ncbi:MAG: OsmC family protein [Chloroflexota bacterium]